MAGQFVCSGDAAVHPLEVVAAEISLRVRARAWHGAGFRHLREAAMTIYFYGADEVPHGCFSNFSDHGLDLDGRWWPTSEHYFQAQKFIGTRHADLIRRARTPLRAAELGRDPSKPMRRDWERAKDDVMRRAMAAKFLTHADIRGILLSTGDEEIVEDTTADHYWGRGRTGSGKNMLGRILMRTRGRLRAEFDEASEARSDSGRPGR
ncbi:NADAR family protein [Streptomyces sp. NBC_01260]|uniref:NADAR family protein n=1 Tax=Streptomyces sp. NBC_01260 TaxID=2903801 RepID=UPI002E369014|nr:NADAR family protein [Streptomyces sp. NBC_01260]